MSDNNSPCAPFLIFAYQLMMPPRLHYTSRNCAVEVSSRSTDTKWSNQGRD
jgi:hypothetical protein